MTDNNQQPTLLINTIMKEAFIFTESRFNIVLRLVALPVIFTSMGMLYAESTFINVPSNNIDMVSFIVFMFIMLGLSIFNALFAVAWHKTCQLGMHKGESLRDMITLDITLWRYILWLFAIMFIFSFVASFVAAFGSVVIGSIIKNSVLPIIISTVSILAIIYYGCHYIMILPAVAVEKNIKIAYITSTAKPYKKSIFGLLLYMVLIHIILWLVHAIIQKFTPDGHSLIVSLPIALLGQFISFVGTFYILSCLSIMWRKILAQVTK